MEHREGRRNQLTFSDAAPLCNHRATVQTLSILDPFLAQCWKRSCRYEDCCLLLYLDRSNYKYWCAAGAAVPIQSYHTTLPWSSRASSTITHAPAVELNRPTVRLLSRCVCLCSFRHLFFARVSLFWLFTLLLCARMHLLPVCIQLNSTHEDCCCCCTCDRCCCCL